jgi:hypothetical protein
MIAMPLDSAAAWDAFVALHPGFHGSDRQHAVDIVPGRTPFPNSRRTDVRDKRAMSGARHAPGMERATTTEAQRIGDEGEALVAEANAWMTRQGVRSPDRMARVWCPGLSGA